MRIGLRWETTYRYSEPVRLLHSELRVLPAEHFGQHLVEERLVLDPDARAFAMHDAFGNRYHHVDFLVEVDRLHVAIDAEVDTQDGPIEAPPLTPLFQYLFTQPTARSPFDPVISGIAAEIPEDLDPVELAETTMSLFKDRFQYEVGTTDVAATAVDLLKTNRGVCQDFSHLMLSILRMRGVPARYVSGYLAPADGEELTVASHAWVQLFDGDAWHGFDPTNHARQDGRYVVVGVGRDYDDVPPLRGTYQGVAEERYSTSVRLRSGGASGQSSEQPGGDGSTRGNGA
jgi:transglutaminase-like putative cysteine protease